MLQCGAASDREHRQTQHEQSKRGRERERVSVEEEKPAAERRHTLSPAGSENRDDSVCVHVCTASSDITLWLLLLLLLVVSSWFPLSLLSPSFFNPI